MLKMISRMRERRRDRRKQEMREALQGLFDEVSLRLGELRTFAASQFDQTAVNHGKAAASLVDHRLWIEALISVNAENPRRAKQLTEIHAKRAAQLKAERDAQEHQPRQSAG